MSRNEVLRSAKKVLDIIKSPSKTPSRQTRPKIRVSKSPKSTKKSKKKRVPYFLSEMAPSTGSLDSASDNLNKIRNPPKHPRKLYKSSSTKEKIAMNDIAVQTTPALMLDPDSDDIEFSVEVLQGDIYDFQDKYDVKQIQHYFNLWKQRFWTRAYIRTKQNTRSIQSIAESPIRTEQVIEIPLENITVTQVEEKDFSSDHNNQSEYDYSYSKSPPPQLSQKRIKSPRVEYQYPVLSNEEVIQSDPELLNLLKVSSYYHNKYCKVDSPPNNSELVDQSKKLLPELHAFDRSPSQDITPIYREISTK